MLAHFNWNKWGCWGIMVSSIITLFIDLQISEGIAQSFFDSFIYLTILYAVLLVGKDKSGWSQLK